MTQIQSTNGEDVGTSTARHSRFSESVFRVRVVGHQTRRGLVDFFTGCRRCEKMSDRTFPMAVGESRSALWIEDRPAEADYQKGKVHNLRTAARELDCALLLPGQIFSFWKQIGRATEKRGYVVGRMLQQGCMIPAVGGGLCQLSNALYDAALQAGCEIVERHAHSRIVPGSVAATGRDATVAWNYVDLRFRSRVPLMIRARVTEDELVVSFCVSPGTVIPKEEKSSDAMGIDTPESKFAHQSAHACTTCAETSCFRYEG